MVRTVDATRCSYGGERFFASDAAILKAPVAESADGTATVAGALAPCEGVVESVYLNDTAYSHAWSHPVKIKFPDE